MAVPLVEISNDRNFPGRWGPNPKSCTPRTLGLNQVTPELVIHPLMTALVEEIEVLIGEQTEATVWAQGVDLQFISGTSHKRWMLP